MDQTNNGGPAFPNVPTEVSDQCTSWDMGMSLRDYFAGQALAGIMANAKLVAVLAESKQDPASCAYEMADYMLAERQKERE